ncbi:MAG: isopeptide-forming domain-containing fimbrial protein [Anaerolineae bacterium]|nr:isopeptide-forming domain-containing fimbrial protein [Anaerolineae bacterium]NIN96837.1 isopeptide-forming domain-containing fimbrial protein [Anaerolineae bacterium]NIQ79818.1 isopeptide-forming domain-containing fimbrial protein [Anaerolineae bacterium]
MKGRTKRWGLVASVALGMVVAGVATFNSNAWAAPAQEPGRQESVPPFKTANKTTVYTGDKLVFEIRFRNAETLTNAVITDDVDPLLTIDDVTVSPKPDDKDVSGQTVTVTYNTLPAGTWVTIRIYCTVRATAPGGSELVNQATLTAEDPELEELTARIRVEVLGAPFVPEPASLLLLSSGFAALAAYGGVRWRARCS